MENTWMIIVNPNAGEGKGLKDWPYIQECLQNNQIQFDSFFTEFPGHAIQKTSEFVEKGYRKFAVVGGDGSMNEAINGVFMQKTIATNEILIANIPVGNGNDWGKTYNNPVKIAESVKLLREGNRFKQDIGKLSYFSEGVKKVRYFANIAGFGFDALVVRDVQKAKDKGKSGALIYFSTLLMDLFKSKYISGEVKIDDTVYRHKFLSIAAGVCKYNGGGMMILPFSEPNNAKLDVTMILNLSKLGVIRNVLRLFSGSFVKVKKVRLGKGTTFSFSSDIPLKVETDGEFLGDTPSEIEILPTSLNVVVNSINFDVNPKLKKYAPSTI
ncbi:MAG: diacylglycerol kinase family lipid kinase [Bacteroidetes bacterium]|nr:diacylglycerol kinase family lipid kinase [Bacteroidota bacterium]